MFHTVEQEADAERPEADDAGTTEDESEQEQRHVEGDRCALPNAAKPALSRPL
jgi:hypothetical protein